ncbi:MAG: carbamoyl phosphate synthase small subunit [Chloroflexi bacterium]|nr:carbamoyl phosphate synthase small subunit [Chloroflexota bacterium]|tara:strand:- start:1385 stop:2473 length:1089 start_codon:yes stop_codon:yes gene_type:complete
MLGILLHKAHLILSDGTVFSGEGFGSQSEAFGEVVFNTSMTGYQEMLTDPSYAGQILLPTYPLQGNYGTNKESVESAKVQVSAFAIKEHSEFPSHYDSELTLNDYLVSQGIPGIAGLDTRAITKRIRSEGVMMGMVTSEDPKLAVSRLKKLPSYGSINLVEQVSTQQPYKWSDGELSIAVIDCGVKFNILNELAKRGCSVNVYPFTSTSSDILKSNPDGVLFSPGPGDPIHCESTVSTAKNLIGKLPILGICLGHQIVARALGAETYKLKFGHRGGNHPVQDLETKKVYITAQNHGYAVADSGLPPEVYVSHRNLNDGTIEGLKHRSEPILTIQYHSEASPGPLDNSYIFDEFIQMVIKKRD